MRLVVTSSAPPGWKHGRADASGVVTQMPTTPGSVVDPSLFHIPELGRFISRGWLAWVDDAPPPVTEDVAIEPAGEPIHEPKPATDAAHRRKTFGGVTFHKRPGPPGRRKA